MARVGGPSRADLRQRGDTYEASVVAAIKQTLRVAAKSVRAKPSLDDIAGILGEWTWHVDNGLLDQVGDAYVAGAHSTRVSQRNALVGILKERSALVAAVDAPFEIPLITNSYAEQRMANARNRLVNVGNEVWEHARGQLLEGLQAGEGVEDLRRRISGVTELAEPRAGVVARTEVNNAMNAGSLQQMRQVAIPEMTKEWISAHDARTREAHSHADGQIVNVSEHFTVGGESVDCPGDGSAENSVNCRCTLGYDVPDEKFVETVCDCGEGELALLASITASAAVQDLPAVCACTTHISEPFASEAEHKTTVKQARKKIKSAPVPSMDAVRKAQDELEKAKAGTGRAGGESRGGSAASRRKQRLNLFEEFGGNERGYVVCHGCGAKIHWAAPGAPENPHGYARFERGKIFVKCQGGGYQLTNLLPECFACNRSRNDKMVRKENRCGA